MTMVEQFSTRKEFYPGYTYMPEGGAMSTKERIKRLSHGVVRSVTFKPLLYAYIGTVFLIAALAGGFIDLTTVLVWETILFAVLLVVVYKRLDGVRQTLNLQYHDVVEANRKVVAYNHILVEALHHAGVPIPEEGDIVDDDSS